MTRHFFKLAVERRPSIPSQPLTTMSVLVTSRRKSRKTTYRWC